MRVVLAGGGDEADSRVLDSVFAGWLGPGARLLYLPIAMAASEHAQAGGWLRSVFGPLGVSDIEVWSSLDEHTAIELEGFAGVYLGGGNTFRLLHELRRTGFDVGVAEYIRSGSPSYGGSAGAIILGFDIRTALLAGDLDEVGLDDTGGLGLFGSMSVACHYRAEDRGRVLAFAASHDGPIVAIPEGSGIAIDSGRAIVHGQESAFLFADGSADPRRPTESIAELLTG